MPTPHFLEVLLDRPIAYHRVFAELTKSVKAALMLSQALYWSKRTRDPDGWFYKPQHEWYSETGLSRREQDTARTTLLECQAEDLPPFWQEQRRGLPARIYYRLDFSLLMQHLERLHQQLTLAISANAPKRQTENSVEPDLTGTSSSGNAPKRQTRLAESANLDVTKPPNKKQQRRQSGLAQNANHSISETTTETTHNNGRGVRVLSEEKAPAPERRRSAFTIKQWLAYAKTQPNINSNLAFANAMARTPDNDGVLELYLELQRQAQEPTPLIGCEKCRSSPGWEHVPGKGTRPCACRAVAQAQLKGRL